MSELAMRDNSRWTKSPFVYKLGSDFTTMQELIVWLLEPDKEFTTDHTSIAKFADMETELLPKHYMRPNQSDTSVGGNDAINCYWQFCENDDIIHPFTSLNGRIDAGMGRVHSETYDKHQQLLHMTMGVPNFGHLRTFYNDMIEHDISAFVNGSYDRTIGAMIGGVLGRLIGGAISVAWDVAVEVGKFMVFKALFPIPFLPKLYLAYKAGSLVGDALLMNERVTRYYDFRSTMPMYYRYVNSILLHLAVNMGLMPDGDPDSKEGGETNGQFNSTYRKLFDPDSANPESLPEILRFGPNIFRILAKRDSRLDPSSVSNVDSDDYLMNPEKEDDVDGWFSGFMPRLKSSMFGADKFISFRVEKSTDSSESVSNNSGESALAQELNSTIAQTRQRNFRFSSGNLFGEGVLGGLLDNVTGLITEFMTKALDTVTFSGLADAQVRGSGYADIPEVWQGSSFAKSYSFTTTLRAPYGDPVSIMQAIYIPLACLLAAALPRSVGKNAYTSPFLIRAYCKGMFAIPLGLIDSMTIKRGASEFGWSTSMLPTVVEVSFTIKDLAPIMHIAMMGGKEALFSIFSQNSSFQEYMLTLSGMGLNERLLWFTQIQRKFEVAFSMVRRSVGSPLWWGTNLGNSGVARLVGALTPWNRFSDK